MFAVLFYLPKLILAATQTYCTLPKGSAFFSFPHWWEYLKGAPDPISGCVPTFNDQQTHFDLMNVLAVGLAVIDMLLYLAGVVAVISIIIAGFTYITSLGNSEKGTAARKRIQNSLIGLGIVIVASAAVSYLGNSIG